jgi:hypothetical protein
MLSWTGLVDLPRETEETREEVVTVFTVLTINSDCFLEQLIFAVETHWLHTRWVLNSENRGLPLTNIKC